MKKNIRRSIYACVLICLFSAIISCEKDFTDIGSKVISNTKFDTSTFFAEVTAKNSPVEKVISDNITVEPGQYLLGVFASDDYEKIEASIVSQITISDDLKLVDDTYDSDTTVVTTVDAVYLKLPYQSTLDSINSYGPDYQLDSIIGDQTKAFNLNVYRSDTYINFYNPLDPTKVNTFFSNDVFEKTGTALNEQIDYQFIPNKNDTILIIDRFLHDNTVYTQDTIKVTSGTSTVPLPFARIALDKAKFKELFLDKYESTEFESQQAFNDYFRGIIIEATGNEGSLVSFNFSNSITNLNPSIEVYYTNTVLKDDGATVIDTIQKNDSFLLRGYRVNTFNMEDKVYPTNDEIIIQGTAGSEAEINLFGSDNDANGIADQIEELRLNNWLINDATLTFYINQDKETSAAPYNLYLYKYDDSQSTPVSSQVLDAITATNTNGINGGLVLDDDGNKEKYTFNITDYIASILNGDSDYSPTLKIKAFNLTDSPTTLTDTIIQNYNWNPRAVTLFNESSSDGDKKATLKISYSEKK
ncbi:DUF4270 domain-containing protein [uncultured Polaribacter sp.]|uniref:DUF4270 domain-containing protein n=1 Tax=uncultured Polaribacter sp. TaxID=174711 RepID=UPI00261356AD|nr:DUF4270 domain-containing protein [uncultured Polaribacter sp.]